MWVRGTTPPVRALRVRHGAPGCLPVACGATNRCPSRPEGSRSTGWLCGVLSSPTLVLRSARCSLTSCRASAGGGSSRLCSRAWSRDGWTYAKTRHRHYLSGTVVTHQGVVEAAVAVLEHALADGQLLDRQKVLRLTAVLRRVVPFSTMQVNG